MECNAYYYSISYALLFFIVSGMLYKNSNVKTIVSKGWMQLLKPYLIMSALVSIIMLLYKALTDGVSIKYLTRVVIGIFSANDLPILGAANWSSALWFCYSLFIIKVLYSYISHGGIILMCLLGVSIMYAGNKLPLRLDSSLVGFVFFSFGTMCSEYMKRVQEYSFKKKMYILLPAFVILCLSAYLNLNLQQRQGLSINAMYYGKYPFLFLVGGISGTAVILLLSTFLNRIGNRKVLTLSNGTIVVLGFHWAIYKLVFGWWLSSCDVIVAMCVALVNLIICFFFIIFFGKYYPAVLGNRKLNSIGSLSSSDRAEV